VDGDGRGRLGAPRPRRVAALAAAAAAGALALAACGGGGPSSATTQAGAAATPAHAAGATGCRSAGAGSTTLSPSIGGHVRTVVVHVPAGYRGAHRVALVLNMHGSASTAAAQEAFTGMDAAADHDGFIVAYPQALIPEGTGFDWNVPGVPLVGGRAVPAGAPDDVSFLVQLVALMEHDYCVDPARVYATGFSGGARTASQLACDASTVFAAVAPVSGLRRPAPCPATRAVPVLTFHGTADPVDPYDGHGQAYWTYSVPQAAQDWASQDGCSTAAATTHPGPGVTLATYGGCRDGATVELYTISGEGHEWPGGPPLPRPLTRVLGPQSNALDADDAIWSFFTAHPM